MLIYKLISFLKETTSDAFRVITTRDGIKTLYGVSLYRNAVYLILDAAITALSGLVFWVVAARLYTTENIGVASAAISANGLLVAFSTLGLGNTLIRFIPDARERAREMINSSFTIGGLVAVAAAFIFVAGLGFWSPALISIRDNPVYFGMFVVFVPANLLYSLSRVIFVAQRRSGLILLQGIIANLLRLIPLFLLVAFLAGFGVFASWGLAILAATVIGISFFIPITQNGYRLLPTINKKIIGELVHFSASNYLVSLLAIAPGSILPLIVLNLLGAEQNAYFYISWTISNTIATIIPTAITTSLFAEGSHDEKTLGNQVKRSLKFISLLLVPLVIIVLFFGKWLLLMFSAEYSQNAVTLLQVLTITVLPLSVSSLYFTIKRTQKAMKSVVLMTGFISIVTLGLSYVLLPRIGLLAAGVGWLGANSAVALFIIIIWLKKKSLL